MWKDLRRELKVSTLVAGPAACVGERFASLRNKLPVVACGPESELENSERIRLPHFAVGFGA